MSEPAIETAKTITIDKHGVVTKTEVPCDEPKWEQIGREELWIMRAERHKHQLHKTNLACARHKRRNKALRQENGFLRTALKQLSDNVNSVDNMDNVNRDTVLSALSGVLER